MRPLIIVYSFITIIGLIILTACTNSSAAPQPPETTLSRPTSILITREHSSELSAVPTRAPTATITPSPSPSPTPTPTLRQLTTGGCCVHPFFSPDGQQVLFIDKPGPNAPVGIYGVNLADPQATPALIDEIIGFRNPDRTIVATMAGDLAHFTNESNGQSWTVDTGGNWPRYSPDSSQILWVATDREGPYDRRQNDIWLVELDGSHPRPLLSLYGGGFAGWFPDSQYILLVGRDTPTAEKLTLSLYNVKNGNRTDLFSHKRLRGPEISPGGRWIAYFISFADEPEDNGLWVISVDGLTRHKLDIPGFGAYRWRDDNTLLYIPMRPSTEASMQLWTVDVSANHSQPLTAPASLSFSISNGDWEVSPDGRHIIFVNSTDQNIWLITLP